jgi:hypothetical protein
MLLRSPPPSRVVSCANAASDPLAGDEVVQGGAGNAVVLRESEKQAG